MRVTCEPLPEDHDSAGPAIKAVSLRHAIGQHALHDMTRIVPGKEKGAVVVAGQCLTAEDMRDLQRMGRNRIYTAEGTSVDNAWIHENDAVHAFAQRMPGPNIAPETLPREGKINFTAQHKGLLSVDKDRLTCFNGVPDVMCATRHHMTVVKAGNRVAGTRAIPLYLAQTYFMQAIDVLDAGPLFSVLPMRKAHIGILVTGTEIFQGTIQDAFAPIVTQKAQALECHIGDTHIVPDDAPHIVKAVHRLIASGADLIITTAGLSVDPDDITRKALLDAGITDLLYGIPVLPGSMSLIGRIGTVQVLGVPACALFSKTTGLDILLPRLLANVTITRHDLAQLGHGGLCMECTPCVFPQCPFGK